eukprot:924130-Prymnesium_polylepis.1
MQGHIEVGVDGGLEKLFARLGEQRSSSDGSVRSIPLPAIEDDGKQIRVAQRHGETRRRIGPKRLLDRLSIVLARGLSLETHDVDAGHGVLLDGRLVLVLRRVQRRRA